MGIHIRYNLHQWSTFTRSFGWIVGTRLFFNIKLKRQVPLQLPQLSHPLWLRPQTSDFPTFLQVFVEQQYKFDYGKSPKVIIDGGANIGLFALEMKRKYPDAQVICIEPDPENFEMLVKNTQAYPNVFHEQAGIWFKDTTLQVYDKYNKGKWALVVEENLEAGNVKALSIGTLMQKYQLERIDVLKLDIETSELELFSRDYLDWLPKVKMVVVELHGWRHHVTAGFEIIVRKRITSRVASICNTKFELRGAIHHQGVYNRMV